MQADPRYPPAVLVIDGGYFWFSVRKLTEDPRVAFLRVRAQIKKRLGVDVLFTTYFTSNPSEHFVRMTQQAAHNKKNMVEMENFHKFLREQHVQVEEFGFKMQTVATFNERELVPTKGLVQCGVDCAIATQLMESCYRGAKDIVLLSGDSDFANPLKSIQSIPGKTVWVAGFHTKSVAGALKGLTYDGQMYIDLVPEGAPQQDSRLRYCVKVTQLPSSLAPEHRHTVEWLVEEHFRKFGEIIDVTISDEGSSAKVSFAQKDNAEQAARVSPCPMLGTMVTVALLGEEFPDGYKSKLCKNWTGLHGSCPFGGKCIFAHGPAELRGPSSPRPPSPPEPLPERIAGPSPGPSPAAPDKEVGRRPREPVMASPSSAYKTVLCKNWTGLHGSCPFGGKCIFAHGPAELRGPSSPRPPSPPEPLPERIAGPSPGPSPAAPD
eukprot:RCo054282